MSFTAKDVAKLRAMTSAGMMDCKKALTETNGDMDEAVASLRKKGIASAAKKADKIAAEGVIASATSADNKSAAVIEVNSQTDFVAKNDQFQAFVKATAEAALANKTKTAEDLQNADIGGISVKDKATELTAVIGEKIELRRVEFLESNDGIIGSYVHPVGFKVGILVEITGEGTSTEKASDIAMHIAATQPQAEFVNRNEIPASEIEKEKDIEKSKDDLKGKPPEIIEKIVTGRVDKILGAKVLLEQPFVKNPDQKVQDYLEKATVTKFVRFNLGEGIEKKVDDFAAEVASMTK